MYKIVTGYSKLTQSKLAAWGLATHDIVSEEMHKSRAQLCNNCDKKTLGFCKICLCNIEAKTFSKYEKCPLKKW